VGKLVRDKIPDIIRTSGRTPHVTMLAASAYRTALYDKLREEVDELIAARTTDAIIEEAADLVEVLIAIGGDPGRHPRQHPRCRTTQARRKRRVRHVALAGRR
jgi:predicted house-cleaning noncanonical NTP pyrophosphatase (MazG superfamily)